MVGNNLPANRVVRYNSGGSGSFIAMGSGVDNNSVLALGVYSGQLYVGGNFSAIGGITVNNIGRWNGTNWNLVSSGTNGSVRSFGLSGGNLIIGGTFTNAGPLTGVNRIVSWTGSLFGAIGSGVTGGSGTVNAITLWSNALIAGGNFTTATLNPVPASNIAAFGSVPAAPNLISPLNGATGVSTSPLLDWSDVPATTTYGVQVSVDPNFGSFAVNQSGLTVSQLQVSSPLVNNTLYFWRAFAANGLGNGPFSLVRFFTTGMVGIINNGEIPLQFNLYQNYPNPFNPTTKIRFDLPNNSDNTTIKLVVYDINGKVVSELLNTAYVAGEWEVDFDASNYSSGVYFYKIEAGKYNSLNKMILIK